ncbi:17766_t:CDS:2, partial [Funneliformis geosporum]
TNSPSDDINYLNENIIFEEAKATVDNVKISINNITKKKISIKNLLNTERVLGKVKSNIYLYYLNTSNIYNNAELMASLLDSHYKELDFKLHDKFNESNPNNSPLAAKQLDLTIPLSNADAESSMYSQKEYC